MDFDKVIRALRRRYVKIQSRLEAGIADRWVPLFGSVLLIGVLARTAIVSLESGRLGPNAGRYAQALLDLRQSEFGSIPISGAESSVAELFGPVLLAPLVLLVGLVDPIRLLLLVQAVALGITVVPLWRLGREVVSLRLSAVAVLIAVFSLHPLVHELALSDFHPETLAVPMIVGLALASAQNRKLLYWLMAIGLVLLRFDLGLAVMVWGVVQLREGKPELAIRTIGIAAAWSLGALLILHPVIGVDELSWGENLFRRSNINLAIPLFVPFLFTPFLYPRYLIPAAPIAILYFVADGLVGFGTPVPIIIGFSAVAAAYALRRLGQLGVTSVFVDVRLLGAMALAAVVIYTTASPLSPYERPWLLDSQNDTALSVDAAVAELDDGDNLRVSSSVASSVAGDFNYSEFGTPEFPTAVSASQNDSDAVVLVLDDYPETDSEAIEALRVQLVAIGFSEVFADAEVIAYRKAG